MEKFRQFSDSRTGINPFVPVWANVKECRVNCLWKPLLAVLRLTLIALLALLGCVALAVCNCLLIPSLVRLASGVCYSVTLRFVLLLFGFWTIEERPADFRKLRLRPIAANSFDSFTSFSKGLVLCNHTSFVEILYLQLRLQPTFIRTHLDGSFSASSFLAALKESLRNDLDERKRPGDFKTISELLDSRGESAGSPPLVVFPEASKSNGTAILEWKVRGFLLEGQQGKQMIHKMVEKECMLVVFVYDGTAKPAKQAATPQHTVYSAFQHLYSVCRELRHSLTVEWVQPRAVEQVMKTADSPEEALEGLRSVMAKVIPEGNAISVSGDVLPEFAKYWQQALRKRQ